VQARERPGSVNQTWFVFDELASLQRLPQLMTALTESRSSNTPILLGFQGKAQIEALYGDKITGAMLSQPMTKIWCEASTPRPSHAGDRTTREGLLPD
jgi:type IV secretory pathway TraG/TraD family ATPase VirD4